MSKDAKFKIGDLVKIKLNRFCIKDIRKISNHIEYEADNPTTKDWTLYEDDLELIMSNPYDDMKELEALEIVSQDYYMDAKGEKEWLEAYELLKKTLTPPTADEVCEALNQYFDNTLDIFYSGSENGFVYTSNSTKAHWVVYKNGRVISFNFDLPAYLVEMIGKFYKGLQND
jgi:hypothetical protein